MKSKRNYNYLLALGHMCSDINQGALSAILPFLIAAHNYNYTTAASLVMVANIVGSVVQPVFGQIADKKNKPWIIGIGLLLAGGGMAVTGFIPNFFGLCIAVMISGIGIAMFHPQAAKMVNSLSDANNKGKSISIFSFGGNLGFSFGPLLATASITFFGLKGTFIFLIPELIFCAILAMSVKNLEALNAAPSVKSKQRVSGIDQWSSFLRLSIVVVGRSIILSGLNTFLALYWISELGKSKATGATVLSVFFAIGAISTLLGGWLSDKLGYEKMIKLSFLILLPSIVLLTLSPNEYAAALTLIPMSCSLSMAYSPLVVLGQQYLPNHVGFASGVTLGLAVSIGGIVAPFLGHLADQFGVIAAINTIAVVAILPLVFSFFLPKVTQPEDGQIASNKPKNLLKVHNSLESLSEQQR